MILIVISIPQIAYANEENDLIIRRMLLGYNFDETSKTIKVYYVQIQQKRGGEPIVDSKFVKNIYLDEDTNITSKNLKKSVKNNQSLYYDIYIRDEIFGIKAPIFADLSEKNISESELQPYIDQALEKMKKDFENPPSKEEIEKQVYVKVKGFDSTVKQQDYSMLHFILKFIFILIATCLVYGTFKALRQLKNKK